MQRFGNDLVLLEKIAAGGMAEVFRAKQIGYAGFEKTVALKRILPHYATSDDFKNMFRLEANLSACLQHNNIAQVFGNGEHDGYLYLIMEFLDGKNVRQLLGRADKEKFRIPLEISCFIVAETAKGLDYAHNYTDDKSGQPMKVVHRDMSPQNIMLTYDGSVKVVDFGIAKAAARSDMTRAGVLKGKFGYMSPEQAKGETLDNRSDIFSLGIILWEMLTQRRLFSADDDMKTLQLVRQCKVMKPSQKNPMIPFELDRIVLKSLSKNRSDRYSSSGEMYADLIRFINDRFPDFISTDLGKYMKGVYKKDRDQERKRREKQNLEAPAILKAGLAKASPKPGQFDSNMQDSDLTPMESLSEDKTRLSNGDYELKENAPTERDPNRPLSNADESLNMLEVDESAEELSVVPKIKADPKAKKKRAAPVFRNTETQDDGFDEEKKKKLIRFGAVALIALFVLFTLVSGGKKKGRNENPVASQNEAVMDEAIEGLDRDLGSFDDLGASEGANRPEKVSDRLEPEQELLDDNVAAGPSPNEYVDRLEALDEVPSLTDENPSADPLAQELGEADTQRKIGSLPPPNLEQALDGATDVLGGLSLLSVPKADKIYVNGLLLRDANQIELSTPLEKFPMPPGKYEVKLENTAFKVQKTVTIEVSAEKITKESVVLED